MSLADELLADLEDEAESMKNDNAAVVAMDVGPIEEELKVSGLNELTRLYGSDRLNMVTTELARYSASGPRVVCGPVEADPEYQLIVEANNLAAEIDGEVVVIHRWVRDRYCKRFPELESLVIEPLEYLRTVRAVANDLTQAKNNESLQQFLTQATIMVVSVTASTTQGEVLSDKEISEILDGCNMAIELNDIKLRIYEYVESRMSLIAPNLSAIIGASTAAKVMGVAGGLTNLSKMPACNVLLLGNQKKTLGGFSQMSTLPHTGFIYHSQLVMDMPPDLRRKVSRLISAKCTLAARVDACHEAPNGSIGLNFRNEIEKKIDKLTEPAPVKFVKPLPKPIDPARKKRGGKRVRKMKERYAMTELRKQHNRINFAEIEEDAYQEDLGYSRGSVGKGGQGRLRGPQVDEKTKVRISKTLQRNLAKQQAWGGSTSVKKQVAGTASSVAFTPLQGLEIVNPQAAEKKVEPGAKYFSNTASFLKLQKEG